MEMRYYNAIKDFGEVYRLFTNKDINYLITCRPYHNDTISFEKWINTELTKNINDFMVLTTHLNHLALDDIMGK